MAVGEATDGDGHAAHRETGEVLDPLLDLVSHRFGHDAHRPRVLDRDLEVDGRAVALDIGARMMAAT